MEISHDEQSAFLNLIPPAADDATVTIEEVEHFLEQHDVDAVIERDDIPF